MAVAILWSAYDKATNSTAGSAHETFANCYSLMEQGLLVGKNRLWETYSMSSEHAANAYAGPPATINIVTLGRESKWQQPFTSDKAYAALKRKLNQSYQ